jgi:NNP family nitrate/nitrite transporter-like MFS transporter
VVQASLLVVGAIPVASAAFANNYTGFMFVRLFIGLVGCSFVATASWTSTMFTKEVVGSANALAAGWGNLGAGVTYLITPLIFDLVTINGTISDNYGWRITLVFPAIFMIALGLAVYYLTDDCPYGNYAELKKAEANGTVPAKPAIDMKKALITVMKRPAVWILAFQYACSFGVELQVHNVLSLFYYEDFTRGDGCNPKTDAKKCRLLSQTRASLISSLFGLMCIFARAMGGYASDIASRHWAMRGRIIVQFFSFAGQAISLYIFSQTKSLSGSIPCLIIFGVFVQACTGTVYGIVPYVAPQYTGVASGIVGAGGNAGALSWGFLFKAIGKRDKSFARLSIFVAAAAAMCGLIFIDGEGSVWRNHTTSSKDNSVHGSKAATEYADESVHGKGLGADRA